MMNSYFVIVSKDDTPVYEADFFKPDLALKVKIFFNWFFNSHRLISKEILDNLYYIQLLT